MLLYRVVLLCCLTFASFASVADTIWLDNGDRLTGKVEFVEGGKLVLDTAYAGTLTISVSQVKTFESDDPVLVKLDDGIRHTVQLGASEQDGQVLLRVPNRQPVPAQISSIEQLLVPRPLVEDVVWEGDISAALDLKDTSGSERQDVDIEMTSRLRHGRWRHDWALDFERDYRDDVKTTHTLDASYDLNRFLTDQWFWATSVQYKRDHLNDIAKQRQLGMGPGYEWWNNALGRFETSARVDRVWLEERDGTRSRYDALGLQWDYRRYLLGKRFELFHSAETQIPDDPKVRYLLDTELGLRYRLTSWASLSIKGELDYLNTTDDSGYRDTRYTMGLGVGW